MKALIADYSENALKLAAVAAKENIADMRDLLDHEEEFFGRSTTMSTTSRC